MRVLDLSVRAQASGFGALWIRLWVSDLGHLGSGCRLYYDYNKEPHKPYSS